MYKIRKKVQILEDKYVINNMEYIKNWENITENSSVYKFTRDGETVENYTSLFAYFKTGANTKILGQGLIDVIKNSINSISQIVFAGEVRVVEVMENEIYMIEMMLTSPDHLFLEVTTQKWFLNKDSQVCYIQYATKVSASDFSEKWMKKYYSEANILNIARDMATIEIV